MAERVRVPELPDRAHDAQLRGLVEQLEQLTRCLPRNARQRCRPEARPGHGGDLERLASGGREGRHAARDRIPDARRQRQRARAERGVAELVFALEQVQQLRYEQRIAARDLVQPLCQLVPRPRVRALRDQVAHVIRRQPGQVDAVAEARQLSQGRGARRAVLAAVRRELALAVGPHDQHAARADQLRHESEREQRGLIGQVQIVEHDKQARALGGAFHEPRERVVDVEAALRAAGCGDLLGGAREVRPVGRDRSEPRRRRAEPLEQLRGVLAPRQRLDHLCPVPVRRRHCPERSAGTPHCRHTAAGCLLREPAGERGLADPRFADQQNEAPAP